MQPGLNGARHCEERSNLFYLRNYFEQIASFLAMTKKQQ